VAVQGRFALPVLRPAVAASAGLISAGVLVAVLGRWLDLGATRRRPAALIATFRPVVLLGTGLAAAAWLALAWIAAHEAKLAAADGETLPLLGPGVWLAAASALLGGVPLLAALGLRGLAAVERAPMPLAQLMQASGHALLGGLGLYMLIGFTTGAMSHELKYTLGTAITALAAHTLAWSGWLLRGSRKTLSRLRLQGVRVPLLERGHWLASAAVVGGLLAPSVVVLANLATVRDTGLVIACSVLAVSNHAMRYAWVSLPLDALHLDSER